MSQFIRWTELLPVYRGCQGDEVIIEFVEFNFIDTDVLEIEGIE